MSCYVCDGASKFGYITISLNVGKNDTIDTLVEVPAKICEECGAPTLSIETLSKLERLQESLSDTYDQFTPFTQFMKDVAKRIEEAGKQNGVTFDDVLERLKEYRKSRGSE